MARCFLCGKGRQVGRSGRHKRGVAGKQWLKRAPKTVKIFKPNLHVTRLEKNGKKAKVKVCTKCLRRIKKKNETIHGWRAVQVAIQRVEEKPVMVKEEKPSFKKASPSAKATVDKSAGEEESSFAKASKDRREEKPKKKPTKKKAKKPAPKRPPAPKSA